MQDLSIDQDEFMRIGGTELAPMSTSASKSVAFKYAASRFPLIFKYTPRAMQKGCSIRVRSPSPHHHSTAQREARTLSTGARCCTPLRLRLCLLSQSAPHSCVSKTPPLPSPPTSHFPTTPRAPLPLPLPRDPTAAPTHTPPPAALSLPAQFLSLYPKEEEVLYPPLTFLQPERIYEEQGYTVVVVTPMMS